ncbi:PGG domain-containing protein [Heracleum sosnowskyi]|uniref:PGG domain-containing protein n=1 Tax=Heracleum sosnowskyi TaxID=360622 RepID=A0AAD8GV05_9APIA|nr:PGG domain-containing protein [Heracleum sosnowskyi]
MLLYGELVLFVIYAKEQKENYIDICVPLYNAALKGDWRAAERIIGDCPNVINMSITNKHDTVLHIVSSTKHTYFAEKLVNMMKIEDLELQNLDGETALCLAVASTVKMVDVLLKRNNRLLVIRKNGDLPFMSAISSGDKHMVEYIYSKTNNMEDDFWTYSDHKRMLMSCLASGLFEIALRIIKDPKIRGDIQGTDVLEYLAYNPSAFDVKRRPLIRRLINTMLPGRIANNEMAEIVGTMGRQIRNGMVLKMLHSKKLKNGDRHTIFHVAVKNRQQNVYNLLFELGSKKLGMADPDGNNILHLAAMKPAEGRLSIVSGAALQMQRELLWFKEVQTRVNQKDSRKVNNKGKTPQELFTEEHVGLMEKGERWMKETTAQCMIVAALIATIMFAAAFTLPGGNNDNGRPIFIKETAFIMFVVTDAISLCTSSASILMFLAILTARYTENDFLVSLPVKLMVGLVTLFISIATMMIAFGASFFLVYNEGMKWIPILVTVLASLPVILFVGLQSHLLFDVINSTFNSRHLFRPRKRMLY